MARIINPMCPGCGSDEWNGTACPKCGWKNRKTAVPLGVALACPGCGFGDFDGILCTKCRYVLPENLREIYRKILEARAAHDAPACAGDRDELNAIRDRVMLGGRE